MPRKARERSKTGIYHVILRGINKQDIFFEEGDYLLMMRILAKARQYKGYMGQLKTDGCEIYAYSIMPNHMHLLIKEGKKNISKVMQKIEDSFINYYNIKYERIGPVFQSRFRSEPVENEEQLLQLMRFIHQNPVRSKLCKKPEDYEYSSWREYYDVDNVKCFVCSTYRILHLIEYQKLVHVVNEDIDDKCMDIEDEQPILNDEHAWEIISLLSSCDTPDSFKRLPSDEQLEYLKRACSRGVSLRQASRLSSLSYYMIRKKLNTKDGEEALIVSQQ